MPFIMKLGYLFSPFIRVMNSLKRSASLYFKRFNKLKPSNKTFNLSSWNNNVVIQTKYGLISGFSDKKCWCWKGIPYASPPTSLLRWKSPIDPVPWMGVRKTRRFGNSASQVIPVLGSIGSEDCLYLNIWRPKSSESKLPVYLYIHGGGNSIGTSAEASYYGNMAAEKSNLLYISVNYRLGPMGWFIHPAVTSRGSLEDKSGNFGTLDLIQALHWVQENIEAFGGDPNNVTIAGESGGAFNVLSLLISPSAKGLFHRAVVESALSFIWSTDKAEDQSNKLLRNLLIKDRKAKDQEEATQIIDRMSEIDINNYFYSKNAFKIIKSIPARDFGMSDWRTIFTDGTVIPKKGYEVFSTNEWVNKVPVIIGCTKDELKLFGYFRKDPPRGTKKYDLVWSYRSLLWRVNGLDSLASQMSSNEDALIYAYRFDWGTPDSNGESVLPKNKGQDLGAHHAAEIPFFLGMGIGGISMIIGKTHTKKNQHGRKKLTDLCMKYLANFARKGNPNGEYVPRWPAWDNTEGKNKILIFDADLHDLKLSYLKERINTQDVIEMIKSELDEPELSEIISYLNNIMPFGILEPEK